MNQKRRCCICGYDDPKGLNRVWLCRNHLAELQGRSIMEWHHIDGCKNSDDVISVDSNLHGYLTAAMRQWPEILKEPDGGAPLIQSARALASLIDHMKCFVSHNERLPVFHVALHLRRLEIEGDRYWERDGLGPIDISNSEEDPVIS